PLRELRAELEPPRGEAPAEVLGVGVHRDELDPAEAGGDHRVDGVAATASDADDLDAGAERRLVLDELDHDVLRWGGLVGWALGEGRGGGRVHWMREACSAGAASGRTMATLAGARSTWTGWERSTPRSSRTASRRSCRS